MYLGDAVSPSRASARSAFMRKSGGKRRSKRKRVIMVSALNPQPSWAPDPPVSWGNRQCNCGIAGQDTRILRYPRPGVASTGAADSAGAAHQTGGLGLGACYGQALIPGW